VAGWLRERERVRKESNRATMKRKVLCILEEEGEIRGRGEREGEGREGERERERESVCEIEQV
jgi:hypothetical protein